MDDQSKYLLDANVFIEAHRRYYAFDIVPSFWQHLHQLAENDRIRSIDRISEEISSGSQEDDLKSWVKSEFRRWFASTDDPNVFASYSEIIDWVTDQVQYFDYAKNEFADVSDSWLLAYAHAYNYTIVTHEAYSPHIKKRVLIPNICRAFDIPYIDTFNMLRKLNIKLS